MLYRWHQGCLPKKQAEAPLVPAAAAAAALLAVLQYTGAIPKALPADILLQQTPLGSAPAAGRRQVSPSA